MLKTKIKPKLQDFQKKMEELKKEKNPSIQPYAQLDKTLATYSNILEKKRTSLLRKNLKLEIFQDRDLRKTLLNKIKKRKRNKIKRNIPSPALGILYLRRGKRNNYFTLCNSKNQVKASLSSGYLKFKGAKLKSKARKAMYNLKKLANMLVGLILKLKFKRLHLKYKTNFPKRVKKTFLRAIGYKRKKFRICKLSRYRCKPHNGCRRSKIRRK